MPRVTTPLYELLSMQRGEIGTGGVKMAPQNVKRPHPVILIASKSHQNALEKVLVDRKVSPNGPLQLNALQGCTPPSRSTEEGRLLSKPAFHPSSQPLLLFLAGSQQLLAGSEQLSTNVASVALQK